MTITLTGREPRLSQRVNNGQRGLQTLSLRRLGTMLNVLPPEAISLDAAAAMLRSEDFYVRFNAARLLSQRGDREARLILQAALQDPAVPTRASAARHLHLFSWYSAEALLRQALADPAIPVQETAMYALCDLRELAGYQVMIAALANAHDDIRAAAAWGLRDVQDAAVVPVLAEALRATEPDIRVKVLQALSANDTPEAAVVVRTALADPDADVVYNAALSLIELTGENGVIEIVAFIRQTSGARLEPLLRGMFHASNYLHLDLKPYADTVLAALQHALADANAAARKQAIWLVVWLRTDAANRLLLDAYFNESDSAVRAHFLRVAMNLMNPMGDQLMADAVVSRDPIVHEMADAILAAGELAAYEEGAVAAVTLRKPELGR